MSADAERNASSAPENNPEEQGGTTDSMAATSTNRKKSVASSSQKLTTSTGKTNYSTSRLGQHTQQQAADTGLDSGGEDYNSDSELSDTERNFLTKGAFLLTPSNELTLEKAGTICEKMNFRGPFSLTKTATGILFKFAEPDDCTAVYKKGFHKVSRMVGPGSPTPTGTGGSQLAITATGGVDKSTATTAIGGPGASMLPVSGTATNNAVAGYCPLVRITLGSQEEANTLLQNGLDFYGATYFPTEAARPVKKNSVGANVTGSAALTGKGLVPGDTGAVIGAKIRELLPVFDATGFTKIPAPAERTIKPRS
ncbi:hypothetical protein B566_EDAN007912 [Ephemera danica]|nr:hypothetical protein B566_EDAN007912 [Ephemera danica]